jgi:hypothetical protein
MHVSFTSQPTSADHKTPGPLQNRFRRDIRNVGDEASSHESNRFD